LSHVHSRLDQALGISEWSSGPKTIPVGTRKYSVDEEQTISQNYHTTHSLAVDRLSTHRKLPGTSHSTQ